MFRVFIIIIIDYDVLRLFFYLKINVKNSYKCLNTFFIYVCTIF